MLTRTTMALLAVLLMTATAWAQSTSFPTASGGAGTSESPYIINSTAELDLLASDVNSGNTYSGIYFMLGDDITYSHLAALA